MKITDRLNKMSKTGCLTYEKDYKGNIVSITHKTSEYGTDIFRFDNRGELVEYETVWSGVPERTTTYLFDRGKCIVCSENRDDGAFEWWGEVRFSDEGKAIFSEGNLRQYMPKVRPNINTSIYSIIEVIELELKKP